MEILLFVFIIGVIGDYLSFSEVCVYVPFPEILAYVFFLQYFAPGPPVLTRMLLSHTQNVHIQIKFK